MISPYALQSNPIRGYTQLYYNLNRYARKNMVGDLLLGFLLTPLISGVLIFYNLFPKETLLLWESLGVWIFLVLLLILLYLPILVYAAIGTHEPISLVSELSALILIYLPRPHTTIQGLSYDDIQNLRRVAEIEQGAADWRGTFVNLIVIGTATATISIINFVSKELAVSKLKALSEILYESLAPQIAPEVQVEFSQMISVAIIALVILLIWASYKLYSYYLEFIASESANRTILFACNEATFLLKARNLQNALDITFREKRELAGRLGCRLVLRNVAVPFDAFVGVAVLDSSDEMWLLIPPKEYSNIAKFYFYGRQIIEKIRDFFLRFRI
ncbi:MAG: hypothetical protein UZ14_CFX002002824 [Chloroflexi bacterium OLB14]|nr:MAG: hypothetical protein UZ14_CFX002002824 [Chloroflexi bacterium OLB14]